MAFSAKVVSKFWKGGLLTVEVEYTDGTRTFKDNLVSRSGQEADWVEQAVARRLAELDGLDKLAAGIAVGPVDPGVKQPPVAEPSPRETYAAKLREFEAWLSALRQGVTTVDRKAFVDLKQWLRDNWQDEYIELYLR